MWWLWFGSDSNSLEIPKRFFSVAVQVYIHVWRTNTQPSAGSAKVCSGENVDVSISKFPKQCCSERLFRQTALNSTVHCLGWDFHFNVPCVCVSLCRGGEGGFKRDLKTDLCRPVCLNVLFVFALSLCSLSR